MLFLFLCANATNIFNGNYWEGYINVSDIGFMNRYFMKCFIDWRCVGIYYYRQVVDMASPPMDNKTTGIFSKQPRF